MHLPRRLPWTPLILVALIGCSETPPPAAPSASPTPSPTAGPTPTPAPAPAPTPAPAAEKKEEPKKSADAGSPFTAKQLAAIKELPAEDQALALAQAKCPVNDGMLGAMGKPFKMMVKGKPVFLCCDGCEEDVKSNPDAILAKVSKK